MPLQSTTAGLILPFDLKFRELVEEGRLVEKVLILAKCILWLRKPDNGVTHIQYG